MQTGYPQSRHDAGTGSLGVSIDLNRPPCIAQAMWLLVLSFIASIYVTIGGIDHLDTMLRNMPGAEEVHDLIMQWRWLGWPLLTADIIGNAFMMPGCLKGRRRSRRGILTLALFEAVFNLPGTGDLMVSAPILASATIMQTALQAGAAALLYIPPSARQWFKPRQMP